MQNYILILNWNGWKHTLECLESVLRMRNADFRVVVCDNASEDGSAEKVRNWANGSLAAPCMNPELQFLTSPPVPKPVSYRELSREEALSGPFTAEEKLIQIQVGENLGYAGGNNVGLLYAMRDPEARNFWIINNDIAVDPDALSELLAWMKQHPDVGSCGTLHRAYYKPSEIQVYGGRQFSRWSGRILPVVHSVNAGHAMQRMDFVHGASVLVTRPFLEQVGLMDESYFLYFEELDWAERARGKFRLGYAPKSLIYHKEGSLTGSSDDRNRRSINSEKYQAKNRVVFVRKHRAWMLPTVLLSLVGAAMHRFFRGDAKRARVLLAATLQGLTERLSPPTTAIPAAPQPAEAHQ